MVWKGRDSCKHKNQSAISVSNLSTSHPNRRTFLVADRRRGRRGGGGAGAIDGGGGGEGELAISAFGDVELEPERLGRAALGQGEAGPGQLLPVLDEGGSARLGAARLGLMEDAGRQRELCVKG